MSFAEFWQQFLNNLADASPLELIAVFTGIASVWFSRKESIWTYPVGLINTTIYVYLSVKVHLAGEASVNLYYTIMSIYGWYIWLKKTKTQEAVVHISYSSGKMWIYQLLFFLLFYIGIYTALAYLKADFFPGAIPWADAFASSTAFTGMWLMTRKKVESWYWWIITNIASIPLYAVKGFAFTSIYYLVLLIFAFWGLAAWKTKANNNGSATIPVRD